MKEFQSLVGSGYIGKAFLGLSASLLTACMYMMPSARVSLWVWQMERLFLTARGDSRVRMS
jgi:hypothetical protein